jgi:hypothetical protein
MKLCDTSLVLPPAGWKGGTYMTLITAAPRVAVLIAIIDNFALADRGIKSLFRYTEEPFVLLLGDNGTGDDGRSYFENWRRLPNTKVIRSDVLIQHGEMIDLSLREVQTPYFVLMDSDTEILSKNWLEEMICGFKEDPLIMEVGSDFISHRENYLAPMDNQVVRYLERFGPWLLMYRSEVKDICQGISFVFYKKWVEQNGEAKYSYWDTGSRIHFVLMEKGYHYTVLHREFTKNFIHYGRVRWRKNAYGFQFSLFAFIRRLVRRRFGKLSGGPYLVNTAKKLGLYQ